MGSRLVTGRLSVRCVTVMCVGQEWKVGKGKGRKVG